MEGCAVLDLSQGPLAVALHDAGGAQQVLAWLRHHRPGAEGVRPLVQGPALVLWQQAFPNASPQTDMVAALSGASFLLSGTGWASDLEHNARVCAQGLGVPSVAFLDHWVNYPMRFERGGVQQWPDVFWVSDPYAESLARACFPHDRVVRVPDLHLEALVGAIGQPLPDRAPELLYVLEPARNDWGRGRPGEFQALDFWAERAPSLGLPPETVWRLRPHPSDPPGKYSAWVASQTHPAVCVDTSSTLAEAVSRARWVAGCETHALVVALAAGRQVFCTLPPWAPTCRLPHQGLVHLKAQG